MCTVSAGAPQGQTHVLHNPMYITCIVILCVFVCSNDIHTVMNMNRYLNGMFTVFLERAHVPNIWNGA